MKRKISLILVFVLIIGIFSSCGEKENSSSGDEKKISIVTTIFPEYDWVMNILGDSSSQSEVTMLLDNGVDLHSFQPSADDIVKISDCDLFVYVGGESDEWVNDALKEATNKNMQVINLMDVLGNKAKNEEVIEGMQQEAEEDADSEAPEKDEHVWLSLKNVKLYIEKIAESLEQIDSKNAKLYESNASDYIDKLVKLDKKYEKAISSCKNKTMLFADRFPFRYLVDDYGLKYYAAFVGCSAESEASFETITFLAQKIDELKLKSVFVLEGTEHKIADSIIAASKNKSAKIFSLDSMQSTTFEDVKSGKSYLSIMKKNLDTIKKTLN